MSQYNHNPYERETVINMCDAEPNMIRIESYQQYWINRILKAKEKSDKNNEIYAKGGIEITENDTVRIIRHTEDMIEAIVPRRFLSISAPRFTSLEQRAEMSKRAKEMLKRKNNNLDADDSECFEETEDFDEDIDDDVSDGVITDAGTEDNEYSDIGKIFVE